MSASFADLDIAPPPAGHFRPGEPCPDCGQPMRGCFADGYDPVTGRDWGGLVGHCDCTKPRGTSEDCELGDRLRIWRGKNRLSIAGLAEQIGVTPTQLSGFECRGASGDADADRRIKRYAASR